MTDSTALLCYNKGCGAKFILEENSEDSCCHHPGEPVFHDAYKGWSCCKKKCTDFTEFLNIKGCTRSFHNNVKPPEPERPKPDNSKPEQVIVVNPLIVNKCVERPDDNTPTVKLSCTISPSLQQSVLTKKTESLKVVCDQINIEVGTICKQSGCKKTYESDDSNLETCFYHDGVPIFHEGLKYWTCCNRKTTDFNTFLEQVGCKTGVHLWRKNEDEGIKTSCRTDWHQTDSYVYVSVYAKGCDPDKSIVEANPVKLKMALNFNGDTYSEEIILYGIIDVKQSSVNLAATKVEIKLKKADVMAWKNLSVAPKKC